MQWEAQHEMWTTGKIMAVRKYPKMLIHLWVTYVGCSLKIISSGLTRWKPSAVAGPREAKSPGVEMTEIGLQQVEEKVTRLLQDTTGISQKWYIYNNIRHQAVLGKDHDIRVSHSVHSWMMWDERNRYEGNIVLVTSSYIIFQEFSVKVSKLKVLIPRIIHQLVS